MCNNNKKNNILFNEEYDKYSNDNEFIDMNNYVQLLNIFQTYYKRLYNKPFNEDLFYEVDLNVENSTNRSMELLYEYLYEYKLNKIKGEKYINLYNENIINNKSNINENIINEQSNINNNKLNINDFDDIYCLLIDNKINMYSPCFLSLLIYLINIDWINVNWTITKIKEK